MKKCQRMQLISMENFIFINFIICLVLLNYIIRLTLKEKSWRKKKHFIFDYQF